MNAELRDFYLSTLGVVQYVPREFVAVDASQDRLLESSLQAVKSTAAVEAALDRSYASVQSVSATESAPTRKRRAIDIDALMSSADSATAQTPSSKIKSETVKVLAVASSSLPASISPPVELQHNSEQVNFRLCYWQPAADLLVFSALDYAQNPPQDQHQLLTNILKAIGKLPTMLPEPEFIDWPVTVNAASDKAGAQLMCSAFLQGRLKQSGANKVLLFGERARRYLLPQTAELASSQVTLADGTLVISTPSLAMMLTQAANKRLTWQAIRCLTFQGI